MDISDQGQYVIPLDHFTDCRDLWELVTGLKGVRADRIHRLAIKALGDERLTGRYVITRLRHTFDFGNPKKHTIQATVIKDSVTKPYSNNLPPNPKRLI